MADPTSGATYFVYLEANCMSISLSCPYAGSAEITIPPALKLLESDETLSTHAKILQYLNRLQPYDDRPEVCFYIRTNQGTEFSTRAGLIERVNNARDLAAASRNT